MVNLLKVAPSTDPAPKGEELVSYVKKLNGLADFIHCDVMKMPFVAKNSIDEKDVREIYLNTLMPLDVHLMVAEPIKLIKKYIEAGAQIVTVHFEAFADKRDLIKTLKMIAENNALAGISINPDTEVMEIMPYLAYVDLVLVMSVEPGRSGQIFKENTYLKVRKLKQIREDYGARYFIEVDGGINPEISRKLKTNGADIIVSGSYVYNSDDYAKAIDELR